MRNMDTPEDIDAFLKNVDKISDLVKGLKSPDTEVQQEAVENADCFIAALNKPRETGVNKTSINTNPVPHSSSSLQNESPEGFMKSIERDAEERRVRRAEREKKATALKAKGNEAFAHGDYETAVKYYTEGLDELRDMQQLYTNRAQAYIKLAKYEKAVSDCEWALRCNEKCIKAYILMGKAYLASKKYNESRSCFEKVKEIEPGRNNMVKEYLTQVNMAEEKENQEIKAIEDSDKGEENTTRVPQLLEKLSRPGQMPIYYRGGLEILSRAVANCTDQTLFRLNGGFSVISSNDMMSSCLLQETNNPESKDLCLCLLRLWKAICNGNDENQKMLMSSSVMKQSFVNLITSEHVEVRKECLALLYLFSQKPHGRSLALDNLNMHLLMRSLMMSFVEHEQQDKDIAADILRGFAMEKKFLKQLRSVCTDSVLVPFTTILKSISASNQHVLPSIIYTVDCLARDDVIHQYFAHDSECWRAFLVATKQCTDCEYKDVLYPLLGLIINLSTIVSPAIKEHAVPLCSCCLGLLRDSNGGVVTRATGVLSAVLPHSPEAVQCVIQGDVVRKMHRLLKGSGQVTIKYAIKTLTVCTAASELAREELVKSDKKLSILCCLLGSSCDEMVTGNAALCLAHCLELEGIAGNLLGTDIVLLLLRHAAGDAKRETVKQNAAIALARLCRSEPRHLIKLRELHGLEILHSCVKLIT